MSIRKVATIVLVTMSLSAFSQKNKVTSTYNYLKYNELDQAKEAIDLATVNAATSEWWKTWYYRAKVYAQIAASPDEKYASQKEVALEEAVKSYKKTLTFEDKKMDKGAITSEYRALVNPTFDMGVKYYQAKNFEKSIKFFQLAEGINKDNGVEDSSLVYNIALAGVNGGMTEVAVQYLDICIEHGYKGYFPYSDKAKLYLAQGNEDEALKALNAGRVKYPNEQSLLTQELNIYLKNERYDEALANLNTAIENEPGNFIYYFARGTIYDNKHEPHRAEADYAKSIELNPEHFDSYYNLGAAYYNEGAEMLTEANNIPPNKVDEYNAAKDAAVEVLKQGLPHLEKAHEINPKDRNTIASLKTVYTLVGNAEKSIEMKNKLEGL